MQTLEIPSVEVLRQKLKATPALSVGILIFSVLFYAIYPTDSDALLLTPKAPLELNLNAISFYIFPHVNLIHLFLNLLALFPLLSRYEKTHGTVYTGVTLNICAVVTAVQYCLVGLLLFPSQAVGGLLAECFTFLMFYCYKEHVSTPVIYTLKVNGREVLIPTLYFPFVNLLVVAVLVPSTSFFGHLAGIATGYLLATGKLSVLFPPLKVLIFIEKKLAPGIAKLKTLVDFVSEEDAVNERGVSYQPIFSSDLELNTAAPLTTSTAPATQPYESFERRLGT